MRDPVKVLAVDDVPENLIALQALLAEQEGLELLTAASGMEALELLLVHDVALALLDVQMPGMDGFELAELMRGTERTRRVPIIFLTAVATDERRRFHGYETGAVDYLLKPVDPQIVRNKVEIFVELAAQRQEIARQRDRHAAALARLKAHRDNSPLAIVEFDAEQRIIAWSAGAERMFGWRAVEVSGLRPSELEWLDAEHAARFDTMIGGMIAGEHVRDMRPLRMRTAVGVTLDCEVYGSALLGVDGSLLSVNTQILDVTDRVRAEETQRLLIGELNHRVKNTLASVQAIATQTLRHSSGASDFAPTFIGRIHALARAHSLLSSTTWQGASLQELVEGQLQTGTIDPERFDTGGPLVELAPEPALHLALVLHELATNAHKYGALSVPEGRVALHWGVRGGMLELDWKENGGPAAAPPARRGFGTALIERSLKAEGGSAVPSYGEGGVAWKLSIPYASAVRLREEPRAARRAMPVLPAGGGAALVGKRVLIVEDEPLVALELATILHDAGMVVAGVVATASDAMAAIADTAIDAVLLDGNLQGALVDDVAAALVARDIPFLFVSGYGRDHLPIGLDSVTVIEKPFDARTIAAALHQLLVRAAVTDAA
ncbi:PAS domain S-box-containing protein [Sphingomonas sp. NFR04]|uniref:response regulator n=1 Tax=Sphingomonas sp. NFR04 TaxID=1566283 RepID=UPI0008E88464|nr:response regulator [Sphingomonas sp. NFR04]SFJ06468.1 PAS domain S-box-containing protein [Sphingomonas sp. NFR04]